MKIYYVGNGSYVKGPAFLRLAENEYLEEGDICIVKTGSHTIAYLLSFNQHTWAHCKFLVEIDVALSEDRSNCLLYSFNGFEGRKGDLSTLKKVLLIFKSTALEPLLEEAVRILNYHKDLIDVSVLTKIYMETAMNLQQFSKDDKIIDSQSSNKSIEKRFFISYFKPEMVKETRYFLAKGMSVKDAIARIKIAYPLEFREAFVEFNRNNPMGSIQDGVLEYLDNGKVLPEENKKDKESIKEKNFEEILGSLFVNETGNKLSLHKQILLLAVMELIEKGEIVSPFIPISKELEIMCQRIWDQYFQEEDDNKFCLQYPFFQMRLEKFWRLEALPWCVDKPSYSLIELRQNFYGAIIDEELFETFCFEERRKILKKVLISAFHKDIKKDEVTSVVGQFPSENNSFIETKNHVEILSNRIAESELKKLTNVVNRGIVDFSRPKRNNPVRLPYGAKVKQIVSDDFVISSISNSSRMLCEFVEAVGAENVYNLRIPFLRGYLVDVTRNLTYASNCKFIKGGFWLNTTGSLAKKLELIQYIADCLKINLKIEIVNNS